MIFTLKKRDVNKGITMDITTLFFLWTKNALWDVIQWTLSFPFNLEFLTVDACLARYYKIMVSTPFLSLLQNNGEYSVFVYVRFYVYCLPKCKKYICYKLSIEKQCTDIDARGLDL